MENKKSVIDQHKPCVYCEDSCEYCKDNIITLQQQLTKKNLFRDIIEVPRFIIEDWKTEEQEWKEHEIVYIKTIKELRDALLHFCKWDDEKSDYLTRVELRKLFNKLLSKT